MAAAGATGGEVADATDGGVAQLVYPVSATAAGNALETGAPARGNKGTAPTRRRKRPVRWMSKLLEHSEDAGVVSDLLVDDRSVSAPRGVRVHNMVFLAHLAMHVHPALLTISLGGRYDAKLFTAWVVHPYGTSATLSVFNNGKVVCTGTCTETDAYVAVQQLAYSITHRFNLPARIRRFMVHNVVGSARLGYAVDLNLLRKENIYCTDYDPTSFPGLQYRYHVDRRRFGNALVGRGRKISVVVFRAGKIVLTGARTYEQLVEVFEQVAPLLARYRQVST